MADGLSDLSDDLLRHILFFAPAREGARTAVLSRRWRWLWRTSGAVNLDSGSFKRRCPSSTHEPSSDSNRKRRRSSRSDSDSKGFHSSAEKALAAADGPIRRLTFFVAEDSEIDDLTRRRRLEDGSRSPHNLMEDLVSNPAARRVEELRIEVDDGDGCRTPCALSLGSLPSEALRVLRIINCSILTAPAPPPPGPGAASFPRLADLLLQGCMVDLVDLLSAVAAAPQLSTLHLQSTQFSVGFAREEAARCYRLLGPAVNALVMSNCTFGNRWDKFTIELDVPRLQYFRCEGSLQAVSRLHRRKPQAAANDIILPLQVDLHLSIDYDYQHGDHVPICELFWKFIQDFNTAKLLKLKLDMPMDGVVLKDDQDKDELLGSLSFCHLEQLQLEAEYNYNPRLGMTSMALLADLLHCCPMVRDLRLKLSKVEVPLARIAKWSSADKEAGLDYAKSVNAFRNRRRSSMASLGGENKGDKYQPCGIIPGLTGERAFSCLQSHLERVSLRFCMDDPNCLEVQLAKFFAENAMVLKEMHIDDGGQEMLEHVNASLRRWIDKEKLGRVGDMRRIKLQH